MKIVDKIKTMELPEMAKYLQQVFDPHKDHFGCGDCGFYSGEFYDPEIYWQIGCGNVNIGTSIEKWLDSEY